MIVEKILKQLTPQRIKKEVEAIQSVKLPAELQKWVDEYEKVGKRDGFIWKWFLKIEQEINDSFAPRSHKKSLLEVKFLITMFIILLDDVADIKKDKKLLNKLLMITLHDIHTIDFKQLNLNQTKSLKLAIKIWRHIQKTVKKYPRYKKFKNIFEYNTMKAVHSIYYDYLINTNHTLINKAESQIYPAQSMQMIIHFILNLMCLERFNDKEYSSIIEIGWEAQKMARIGNWIGTWEREIYEGDFTSGIFAYAINLKILNAQELKKGNSFKIIKKIKKANIEKKILKEWEEYHRNIFNFDQKIKAINTKQLLHKLEKLLILEIVSKKYK